MGQRGCAYVDGVVALRIILPVSAVTLIFVSFRFFLIFVKGHVNHLTVGGPPCVWHWPWPWMFGMKFLCNTSAVEQGLWIVD